MAFLSDADAVALLHQVLNNQVWHTALLRQIIKQGLKMADTLDEITADVANETTVEASLIKLLNGIAAQLISAGQDPTKLAALHASLLTNIASMTAAIQANTPAAPASPAP
jgi:hypothetical protein